MFANDDLFFFRKPAGLASTRGKERCLLDYFVNEGGEVGGGIADFPHFLDAFNELTAVTGLKGYDITLARKQLTEEFSSGEEYGLLNRLDTDTSGLLYFARSREIYTRFRDLQRAGKVEKYYLAQVWGEVRRNVQKNISNGEFYASVQENTQGIVLRFPIMHHRHDDERMVSCQTSEGVKKLARQGRGKVLEIESMVTPLSYDPVSNTTVVRVMIHQGVRHQIRVHLATLGNPIIGDGLYGKGGGVLQLVSAGARIVVG